MALSNNPTSRALLLADQCSAMAMADSDAPPGFPQLPAGDSAQGFALSLLAAVGSSTGDLPVAVGVALPDKLAAGIHSSMGCHSSCQACQHAHAFKAHDQRGSRAHWHRILSLLKLLR